MFVTNWISTTKIQKISEITNFFRHYFLSRTEVINSIRKIVELSKTFNSSDLYIGEEKASNTTKTYNKSMCEGSIGRTLPLFYALLSYKQGETTLYDWMRVMRNLILNTSVNREDLPSLMLAMG